MKQLLVFQSLMGYQKKKNYKMNISNYTEINNNCDEWDFDEYIKLNFLNTLHQKQAFFLNNR